MALLDLELEVFVIGRVGQGADGGLQPGALVEHRQRPAPVARIAT